MEHHNDPKISDRQVWAYSNNYDNNVFILRGTHSWYIQPIFTEALKIYKHKYYTNLNYKVCEYIYT